MWLLSIWSLALPSQPDDTCVVWYGLCSVCANQIGDDRALITWFLLDYDRLKGEINVHKAWEYVPVCVSVSWHRVEALNDRAETPRYKPRTLHAGWLFQHRGELRCCGAWSERLYRPHPSALKQPIVSSVFRWSLHRNSTEDTWEVTEDKMKHFLR